MGNTPTFYGAGTFPQYQIAKKVSSAFTGGTLNAHGNDGGTSDPYSLFTVTGIVYIRYLIGFCNIGLSSAGGGTIVLGTTASVNAITGTHTATNLVAGDFFMGGTASGSPADIIFPEFIVAGGVSATANFIMANTIIKEYIGTANVTAGQIDYYCIWSPISEGASVVAA